MATREVVDQLADEYAAAGKLAFFVEQNVDTPLGARLDRWWAAHGIGEASLPFVMAGSGHQFGEGYLGAAAHDVYQGMVDAELARPPQAEISAFADRVGDQVHWRVWIRNLSDVTLSPANGATVHGLVYEVYTPSEPFPDPPTERVVRGAAFENIQPALPPGATAVYWLQTDDITGMVDWANAHSLVMIDYRPGGAYGPYDMLQAAVVVIGPTYKLYLPITVRGPAGARP